jgi:guanylate kinase
MNTKLTGHVVIVMAPMGSGKGTVIRAAESVFPDTYNTVSCTTREPRPGEVDGREYHFITSADFDQKIAAGEFLEWAHFGLNRYGTLKSEIVPYLESGRVVIAEIELQGVEQLHKLLPKENITTVYIDAGGWEMLRARALARAPISDAELSKRYERYLIEIESKPMADIIIDNSTTDSSKAEADFVEVLRLIYTKISSN